MSDVTETVVTPETSASIEASESNVPSESPQEIQESTNPQEEVETEVEVKPSQDEQEDLFTKRFAALTKREKKLVEERAKMKELENRVKEYEGIKEQGVAKALEAFGFSIDDVINYALGEDAEAFKEPVDPNEQLRKEFEEYKQSIEQKEQDAIKARQEAEQKQIDQAITNHKDAIAETISKNSEKYELIASQGQQELVWEVTEAHFNETGEILSIEDAADKVESYLEAEVQKLLKLKKFGKKEVEVEQPVKDTKVPESKTLTSNLTSSTPIKESTVSHEDSLKKAAELLKWN